MKQKTEPEELMKHEQARSSAERKRVTGYLADLPPLDPPGRRLFLRRSLPFTRRAHGSWIGTFTIPFPSTPVPLGFSCPPTGGPARLGACQVRGGEGSSGEGAGEGTGVVIGRCRMADVGPRIIRSHVARRVSSMSTSVDYRCHLCMLLRCL